MQNCETCGRPLPIEGDWTGLEDVKAEVERLGFDSLLDPALWNKIEKLTEGTPIYYLDELRRYAVWLEARPPNLRHRNHRRGFMNWLNRGLAYQAYKQTRG